MLLTGVIPAGFFADPQMLSNGPKEKRGQCRLALTSAFSAL